jgi:hypothetical protein
MVPRYCFVHLMIDLFSLTKIVFTLEKGLLPKNPRYADKGLG